MYSLKLQDIQNKEKIFREVFDCENKLMSALYRIVVEISGRVLQGISVLQYQKDKRVDEAMKRK